MSKENTITKITARLTLAALALLTAGPISASQLTFIFRDGTYSVVPIPQDLRLGSVGINDAGQILFGGQSADLGVHAFLETNGVFTTIDPPNSLGTYPRGINNFSEIVGSYDGAPGTIGVGGFLYSSSTFTNIDVPGSLQTSPAGINDNRQIVGYYYDATNQLRSFLYTNGIFITIDAPGHRIQATGINDQGQIVGVYDQGHGFLYSNGMFMVFDFPGSQQTFATGINDSGQIVGFYVLGNGTDQFGFLYANGVFTQLKVPGSIFTGPTGINDNGVIVGQFSTPGAIPEPGAMLLIISGLGGLMSLRKLTYPIYRRKVASAGQPPQTNDVL